MTVQNIFASMVGRSSGVRGIMPKSTGGILAVNAGGVALGYAGGNMYSKNRDASQVNMWGASILGGPGGMAGVAMNRHRQGQNLFTRPGSVNNHLFPGGKDQGIG